MFHWLQGCARCKCPRRKRHGNILSYIFHIYSCLRTCPNCLALNVLNYARCPLPSSLDDFLPPHIDRQFTSAAAMVSLKFWNNPSYDRATNRTDNKRRIKLLRSYAPDWSVYSLHITFMLIISFLHRTITILLAYELSIVQEIMSFVDSLLLGLCSSPSMAFMAFEENSR